MLTSASTADVTFSAAPNDGADRYVLQTSDDGGATWQYEDHVNATAQDLALDAQNLASSTLLAVFARLHPENVKSDRVVCTEEAAAVLAPTVCSFVLTSASTADVTFSAAPNDGADRYILNKSDDNGSTWQWDDFVNATDNDLTLKAEGLNPQTLISVFAREYPGPEASTRVVCTEETAAFVTQALWTFDEVGGPGEPAIDSVGGFDGTVGVKDEHTDDVVRSGGAATFTGTDGSIVAVQVDANPDAFRPTGGELRWEVEFSMNATEISALTSFANPTWNVMQRGFFGNPGGQWKIQIIKQGTQAYPQCTAKFASEAAAKRVSASLPIQADQAARVICTFNAATNELTTTYRNESVTETVTGNDTLAPTGSTSCTTSPSSERLGDVVTIGNKPACSSINADDAFRGVIYEAAVSKR